MNALLVGIDAGGTGIRLAVASEECLNAATIVETSSAADGGPEPLLALTMQGLISAGAVRSMCAGIAKHSRGDLPARWHAALSALFPAATVRIVPDYAVAFRGALPGGVGIAAIAGTGSIIYGQDAGGGSVRVGGHGWEFGDEGSGAWLTAEAVRRTVRAADGLQPQTPLTVRIFRELTGEEDMDAGAAGVRIASAARARAESEGRGFLVPLLADAASAAEAEAGGLFVGAAGWLGAQVRTAAGRLRLVDDTVRVAMVGGLWNVGAPITTPFVDVLDRFARRDGGVRYIPVREASPPCIGALRIAADAVPAVTLPP
jgi:glucosamine kinase